MLTKILSKLFTSITPTAAVAPPPIAGSSLSQQTATDQADPLFAVKKAGKEIASKLFMAMSTEKGIHLESLLSALGALAGYACQVSVREDFVVRQGRAENDVFILVHSKQNSDTYYFGDLLNRPLAESRYSVWSLSSGATQKLGLQELIDLHDIFKHVTATLGTVDFGVPRVADEHKAKEIPLNYVSFLWPQLFPLAQSFCPNPTDWPIIFGVAIQEILFASKDLIAPKLALTIVMESAVPMSKIYLADR
ncbi:hypothetical protein H8K52_07915 [Undibacterium seohonense]|uniref:Uncharacterized protein n=1 Tax=Undibacterium seohonense TaxID=1344950 RepID=A0ABR6X3L1_9BURK|nr:hypothetical protein [Undibacterium seohonense]MBC3807268.1 hypothetical protein [Undibacterium seohonense]